MDKQTATDLIDIYWKDIHHSRNQDWKFLLAILTSILGLGQSHSTVAKLGFSMLGVGICIIGAIIAYEHWKLLVKKTCVIEQLEDILAKNEPEVSTFLPYYKKMCMGAEKHDKLSVSGLIFLFYFLFLGFFGTAFVYFYSSEGEQCLNNCVFWPAVFFVGLGLVLMLCFGAMLKKRREKLLNNEKSQ